MNEKYFRIGIPRGSKLTSQQPGDGLGAIRAGTSMKSYRPPPALRLAAVCFERSVIHVEDDLCGFGQGTAGSGDVEIIFSSRR
jgi:hypothetical protein